MDRHRHARLAKGGRRPPLRRHRGILQLPLLRIIKRTGELELEVELEMELQLERWRELESESWSVMRGR